MQLARAGEKQAFRSAKKAALRVAKKLALKRAATHNLQGHEVEEVQKAAEAAYLKHLKLPSTDDGEDEYS